MDKSNMAKINGQASTSGEKVMFPLLHPSLFDSSVSEGKQSHIPLSQWSPCSPTRKIFLAGPPLH
jgi:hypothetical protein